MKFRVALITCLLVCTLPALAIPCNLYWPNLIISDAVVWCSSDGYNFDMFYVTEFSETNRGYELPFPPNPDMFGLATVFCEPDNPYGCGPGLPQQAYSDIFGLACAGRCVSFLSDVGNGQHVGFGPDFIYVYESQSPYDVTKYFDPRYVTSVWFFTEGPNTFSDTETPEPGTMLLWGSGLALLARKLRGA